MIDKSSKFRYVVNGRHIIDRPAPLKNIIKDIYFSLGKNFDNYTFRRQSVSLDQVNNALESRVVFLRQKYDYIRLWFGGGKDCSLALNAFIKHNVKIDEIVVARRCCKHNLGLYPEFNPLMEIDSSAIEKLKLIKNQLLNTKITIIDFDDAEFEAVFENPKWFLETSEWFFSVAYLPKMFHKFVNPKFNLLQTHNGMCELVGSSIPAVTRDNNLDKWRFSFNSAGFNPIGPAVSKDLCFEDFLVTDDDPSLFELHVNSIIDSYEGSNDTPIYSTDVREFERSVRDRSLFFKQLTYNEIQLSKSDLKIDFPSEDYFWRAGQSTRTFYELINRFNQDPIPRCLERYINNTDWNIVRKNIKGQGFSTKTWYLE